MTLMQVDLLKSPSTVQIDEMVSLIADAFEHEPMIKAMTGGDLQLRADLLRLTLRAAALEGSIFVVQGPTSQKLVSVGICFGPGINFLGSQAQRELGAEEFFASLSHETKEWWEKIHIPMSKKFVEDTIGQEKITATWFVTTMATLKTEQGKGYGTLVMKEICRRVLEDKSFIALNATSKITIDFYRNFGLEVVGSADIPSPFGSWTNNLMIWYADNSNAGHVTGLGQGQSDGMFKNKK